MRRGWMAAALALGVSATASGQSAPTAHALAAEKAAGAVPTDTTYPADPVAAEAKRKKLQAIIDDFTKPKTFINKDGIEVTGSESRVLPNGPNWIYYAKKDELRGEQISATIDTPIPDGEEKPKAGILVFRIDSQKAPAFVFTVGDPIDCQNICRIKFSFDNGPIQAVSAFLAKNDDKTFYLLDDSKFLVGAKKAHRIVFELLLKDEHLAQYVFSPSKPLMWPVSPQPN